MKNGPFSCKRQKFVLGHLAHSSLVRNNINFKLCITFGFKYLKMCALKNDTYLEREVKIPPCVFNEHVLVSDCRFGVSPVNYPDPDHRLLLSLKR